ncbi:MAG: AsnC family transcriptional regulator [Sulfurimonas sp. RIFCSPHIGHO2_12_FULL_36_9]|uniref:siroheme decarboxylase subunit alpha n=1 Tax=Sulfurimonas sp. RIFCSPLOWO2_12_36_12 TaxID=1802253 RepID=UPI0008AFED25|nr:Lrp/AsnC family transcriptional regulator [Sulfurimonas sp. RIFCSPLOWO2_12_36_12]OHD96686.1 MAG: AsnC family transcriptional regulator [Sulfurimonas sp. RIFCSPHIGHO2_12_FULL_36_9]OHD97961.1 MAG: AsnC family transcriptional regulator [Sulfurimonas sp. RIFCSPLOWO2_02_FULL_36_28]OHE00206.1 MAG: AsnC family transcriptional regulator [Sulfurimonas sp. RIFCSPLOWO2_12_36_12]OHE05091.1 MAG: AsnC family transcriptional regulator [Sulfurimonas sp. RIFCSPLOWO2_12_FULL_36_74]
MKDEILSRIQKKFPLVARPFKVIADELDMSEDEVLSILQEQKKSNIIRQTSAIFDTKRLGYVSSLVAFKIPSDKISDAVKIINSHPGISHNYERNHDFNIWFTVAVSPTSVLGLEKTVEILAKATGAEDYIMLPTLKLFKINVKLNTTGNDEKKEHVKKVVHTEIEMTPLHHAIVRRTQYDIEMVGEPFKKIVDELNIDYDTFFSILNELQEAGVMRRFASILNHRKAGFGANAMVVWDVDEEKGEAIGEKAATFSAVSHCYLRPKYANWPYNLFTMVHGKSTEETNGIIAEMASEIESKKHMPLYSSREFKKVRIEYFTPEFEAWEEKYSI